jgi:hypothetical protein
MNAELLETLYDIYETIDISICKDNNPEIFYKSILFLNTSFYTQLYSHQGPSSVFDKNKQKIIDFTIKKRCRFMPILEFLKNDVIINYIQIITDDAVISYNENISRVEDKEYINGDYVFMVFEFEKKNTHIPLCISDDQYIKFLNTLVY